MDESQMEAKISRLFAFEIAQRTIQLIRESVHILGEFIGEMASNMLARRITTITDRTKLSTPTAFPFRFQCRHRSLLLQELLVLKEFVQLGMSESDVLDHFIAVDIGVVAKFAFL